MFRIGSFKMTGERINGYCYFDVSKVGEMVIIEFFNNAILPLRLLNNHLCLINLNIGDCTEDTEIGIDIYDPLSAAEVDIVLNIEGQQIYMRVDNAGGILVKSLSRFVEGEVIDSFLLRRGIHRPVGIAWAGAQCIKSFGYEFKRVAGGYIITFKNDMRFPIVGSEYEIHVLDSSHAFAYPIRLFCVRVYDITQDSVDFRLILNSGNVVSEYSYIHFGKNEVTYRGRAIKRADIAKQFLRLGGS